MHKNYQIPMGFYKFIGMRYILTIILSMAALIILPCFLLSCNTETEINNSNSINNESQGTNDIEILLSSLRSNNTQTRLQAVELIIESKTDILPILLDINYRDHTGLERYKELFIKEIGESAIITLTEPIYSLRSKNEDERSDESYWSVFRAIEYLGILGPVAGTSSDLLTQIAGDISEEPILRGAACQALEQLLVRSDEVKLALYEALTTESDDFNETMLAVDAAFAICAVANSNDLLIINYLEELLGDPPYDNEPHIIAAACSFYILGNQNDSVFAFIEANARNQDGFTQEISIKALSRIGNEDAINILSKIISDEDESARIIALNELERCGPRPEILTILVEVIQDDEITMKYIALEILIKFGHNANPVLPLLKEMKNSFMDPSLDPFISSIIEEAIIRIQ